jgi:hypothetical protein
MQKGDKQWNETKQKDHKQIKRKERIKGNKRKKKELFMIRSTRYTTFCGKKNSIIQIRFQLHSV